MPLILWACCGMIAGIVFAEAMPPAVLLALGASVMLSVLAVVLRGDGLVGRVCMCLVAAGCGASLFWVNRSHWESHQLSNWHEEYVSVRGLVYSEPDRRDVYTNYRLHIVSLTDATGRYQTADARILLRHERYPEYAYGAVLEVYGLLEEPFETEDFSYKDYLQKEGIYSVMQRVRSVRQVDAGKGNPAMAAILAIKHRLEQTINRLLPEPESSLLAGLLLGVRRGFSASFQDDLRRTGTTHIIAISGYNISIIVMLLQKMMDKRISRKRQLPVFTVGITIFVILVGASASVVRAAFMGWLLLLAGHYGRLSRVTLSLLVASACMCILDPYTLWDIGFQLSFLATGGIIWVYPCMEQSAFYQRLQKKQEQVQEGISNTPTGIRKTVRGFVLAMQSYFWESLLVTLSAQVLVLPVILHNFGNLSWISPLVNIFVLFPIPWAMLLGFMSVIVGLVSPIMALPFTGLAWVVLHYIVRVIELFSAAGIGFSEISFFSLEMVVLYYAAAAAGILFIHTRQREGTHG